MMEEEPPELNVDELIIQRDVNKKEKIQTLKEETVVSTPSNHKKVFELTFDSHVKRILKTLELLETNTFGDPEFKEQSKELKDDIKSLNNYLSISSGLISNYSLAKKLQSIQSLENKISVIDSKRNPKRKFGFRGIQNKDKAPQVLSKDEVDSEHCLRDVVESSTCKLLSLSISCGFSDKKNDNSLKLVNDEILMKDVELRNLDCCIVSLCGNPSTVHMNNISKCTILCGPVTTSVFIDDCCDSNIIVACQQLRVHSTKNCNFYLHVTSSVIIEDTCNVQFAPYNLQYEELEEHFKGSGLCRTYNNWNKVNDFNWLASDAPSPNWSIMKLEDRHKEWCLQ